jgi:hypothetical protein
LCPAVELRVANGIADCIRPIVPQPRIGNQINATPIFAWSNFVNIGRNRWMTMTKLQKLTGFSCRRSGTEKLSVI